MSVLDLALVLYLAPVLVLALGVAHVLDDPLVCFLVLLLVLSLNLSLGLLVYPALLTR